MSQLQEIISQANQWDAPSVAISLGLCLCVLLLFFVKHPSWARSEGQVAGKIVVNILFAILAMFALVFLLGYIAYYSLFGHQPPNVLRFVFIIFSSLGLLYGATKGLHLASAAVSLALGRKRSH